MQGILCFGDSITVGRGKTPNIGWAAHLKEYFEALDDYNTVYNLGIEGNTTSDLLKRFDIEASARIQKVRATDKYLVLIAIGTNDCRWINNISENTECISANAFRENVAELVVKARALEVAFAFVGLPPVDESLTVPYENTYFKNERVELFNQIVAETCAAANVPFLDVFSIMSKQNYKEMLDDGLHPNSAGYEFMFQEIKKFIQPLL